MPKEQLKYVAPYYDIAKYSGVHEIENKGY